MNFKPVWAIILCTLIHLSGFGQLGNKFKMPDGVLASDYEAGAVWVKIKPEHKGIFHGSQASGRRISKINATRVKPFVNYGSKNKSAARIGPRKIHVDISLYYKINFDKNRSLEEFIDELYATGYFEVIEPIYFEQLTFSPNDPSASQQYYLNLIKAYDAWDITQGSSSIVIGVVDTGGDLDHPDLENNIYIDPADPTDGIDNDQDGYIDNNRGWDFSGADAALIDTPGFIGDNNPAIYKGNRFRHGTMVAGCASATTNDGIGISGVGFKSKLLFTKHYADNQPDNSTTYSSDLYEGVLYAATHGAKIINCSWGRSNSSVIAQDIIAHVTLDLGCLVVAAAGNSNVESPLYPAAYDHVLSVASSDENDLRSTFSNYGRSVDISAPGTNIYTTDYNNAYRKDSGTSLATPIVSGAAALVWAHNPTFTPLQVAEQLRISADTTFYANNPAYVNKLGRGRLNIQKALTLQSPSIRASNQMLVNEGGHIPDPGEKAKLYFDFTNYLKSSSPALVVTLTSASPYLNITKNKINLGAIGENTTVKNTSNPFELTLASNFPTDQQIEVLLTFDDGLYHDFQIKTLDLPSFIDINENNITTTITSAGRLGFGNTQSQTNGSGFIYNDKSILYEMGLIMGSSSPEIFDNVRGTGGTYNQDFTAASKIFKITLGERAYSEVLGTFRNAPVEGSESLLLSYRSMVWKEDPYKNFVILEYKIKNKTSNPIANFHMGIFADWDIVSGGAGDRASWDNDTRLGYVFPAQPSTLPRAGIQVLSGGAQYYAIDNDNTLAGNPFGIYDGFTDTEKFSSISSGLGKIQAGGAAAGNDVSHVVGAGPYTIAPGQEIIIAFALHGANTTPELINSAKYADSLYNYTFTAQKPVVNNSELCSGDDAIIQASGATKFNWYKDFVGGTPIFSGPALTLPGLENDTIVYVSNAEESYESLRAPAAVNIRANPVITTSGSLEFCDGDSVVLSVEEADEYLWSTGENTQSIEASTTGVYTVAVKNGLLECTSPDAVSVTVHPNPSAAFIISKEEISPGDEIVFTSQDNEGVSWHWAFGDGTTSTEENPEHIYASLGNYTIALTVTSAEGCVATQLKPLGIITSAEGSFEKSIQLYPNPVYTESILIYHKALPTDLEIDLFNVQGKKVNHTVIKTSDQQHILNISDLCNGMYTVRIVSEGKMVTKKIVVIR